MKPKLIETAKELKHPIERRHAFQWVDPEIVSGISACEIQDLFNVGPDLRSGA